MSCDFTSSVCSFSCFYSFLPYLACFHLCLLPTCVSLTSQPPVHIHIVLHFPLFIIILTLCLLSLFAFLFLLSLLLQNVMSSLFLNCVRTLEQPEETHKGTKTSTHKERIQPRDNHGHCKTCVFQFFCLSYFLCTVSLGVLKSTFN